VATPPHTMSRSDYPFDRQGNYKDSWATGGSSRTASRSSSPSSSRSSTTTITTNAPRKNFHLVKKGDTLFALSRRYRVTLDALRRANGLDTYTIRTGQVLRIPSS